MQTTSQPSIGAPAAVIAPAKVNWPHVAWFLGLAFGLSWLADLVLYWNGGLTSPMTGLLLQFQMLLPAFSAMLLGPFSSRKAPSITGPTAQLRAGLSIFTCCSPFSI